MNLKKEVILIIIVIIAISILEILTSNISKKSIEKISNELDIVIKEIENNINLKETGNLDDSSKENTKNKIKELKNDWIKEQDKLSMFVEHDELEKVTEALIILEENSKNEEYETALENSAEFKYWLKHFEEKERLKIKNIF